MAQMASFRNQVRRSAKSRTCPECRTKIPVGKRYVRLAGVYDSDFYVGYHCLPCHMLMRSFFHHALQREHCIEYNRGELINDVADYLNERRNDLTLRQMRTYALVKLDLMRFKKPFFLCREIPEKKAA